MAVSYRPVKMPAEAFESYKKKIKQMEDTITRTTKKPVKIPFTEGVRFFSKRPLYIEDNELIDYFIRKKRRLI